MMAIFALALIASGICFNRANPPLPYTDFSGLVTFELDEDAGAVLAETEMGSLNAYMTISDGSLDQIAKEALRGGAGVKSGIKGLRRARALMIAVEGPESRKFARRTVTISLHNDARLSNVRINTDVWEPSFTEAQARVTVRSEELIDSGRPTQRVSFTLPEFDGQHPTYFRLQILGNLSKPVATQNGDVADISLPGCQAYGSLFESCELDAGNLTVDESVTSATSPPEKPYLLNWVGRRIELNRLRVTNAAITKTLDTYIFVAGALIGVAGNAAIELGTLFASDVQSFGVGSIIVRWFRRRVRLRRRRPFGGLMTWHLHQPALLTTVSTGREAAPIRREDDTQQSAEVRTAKPSESERVELHHDPAIHSSETSRHTSASGTEQNSAAAPGKDRADPTVEPLGDA
jgi:hypothetical protein